MRKISIRSGYVLGLVFCIGMFVFAAYLQFNLELAPCPLCDLQRIVLSILTLVYLFAAIQKPHAKGAKRYAVLIVFLVALGCLFAGRHIWLQHQPPGSVESCGFGLEYLFKTLPLTEVLQAAMQGGNGCAKVLWQFWSFSIPEWTFFGFVILGVLGVIQAIRA